MSPRGEVEAGSRQPGSFRYLGMAGASTAVNLLFSLVRAKFVAVLVGPAAVAALGQLTHLLNLATFASQWGLPTGVSSELPKALKRKDAPVAARLSSTFGLTIVGAAAAVSLAVVAAARLIADSILPGSDQAGFVRLAGWALLPSAVATVAVTLLGAHRLLRALALHTVAGGLAALMLTFLLLRLLGYRGLGWVVLAAAATSAAGALLVAHAHGLQPARWWDPSRFDGALLRRLLGYGLAASASSVAMQLSGAATKAQVIAAVGLRLAGAYQAAWSISAQFTMLFVGSLGTYLLPHLATIDGAEQLRDECSRAIRLLVSAAALPLLCVAAFPERVLTVLYSSEFGAGAHALAWFVVGDALRLASRVMGTLIVARRNLTAWLVVDLLHAGFVPLFAWFALPRFGIAAPAAGYACGVLFVFVAFNRSSARDGIPVDRRAQAATLGLAVLAATVGLVRREMGEVAAFALALVGGAAMPWLALRTPERKAAVRRLATAFALRGRRS
jgi:PST family polysaccharide transporter